MEKLIECVPNFSEGRDQKKIDAIVGAVTAVPGVVVLDVEKDPDHNRSVLTFVAGPEAVVEAAFRCAQKSAELIDLNHHKGEHPRMGAVDVIPFIPVGHTAVADCVALAGKLAERIGRELKIPVYLYDQAARRPERSDLANVRKGQFEGLRDLIGKDPAREPDFGPNAIHPTAGAVAVGARDQIINFNVNLKTRDMALGKEIAKAIRASSGGFPFVRAKEIDLADKGMVQISTVLTNHKKTPVHVVFEKVVELAAAKGVALDSTEIVGLAPQAALIDYASHALKLQTFNPAVQILENRLTGLAGGWQAAASTMADAFAEPTPAPGGGSASAIVGTLAASLGLMVVRISSAGIEKRREKYPDADRRLLELSAFEKQLSVLDETLKNCVSQDAQAFEMVMGAYKIPKEDPDRPAKIQQAMKLACEVPFLTAKSALSVLHRLADLERLAIGTVASDLKVGRHLARACIYGAIENVKINLPAIKDPDYTAKAQRDMVEVVKAICE